MLKHHLGIVVHIAAQFLFCLPGLLIRNALILHNTPALQQREYLLRLCGNIFCLCLLTRAGFLQMFHIQCLLCRVAGQFVAQPASWLLFSFWLEYKYTGSPY